MYILFDGMPCTGKTTIAKKLAEKLNAHYMKSVVSDTIFGQQIKQFRDSDPTTMDYFYLIDNLIDEIRLRELLHTQSVVRDKCHIASLAHLDIQGFASNDTEIQAAISLGYEKISEYSIKPDCIVFFKSNIQESMEHISEKRDCSNIDLQVLSDTEIYHKQSEAIKRLLTKTWDSKIIEVQPFSMNIEEMCNNIYSMIQN